MIQKLAAFVLLLISSITFAYAQQKEILADNIYTLQVLLNNKWNQTPILRLSSSDYLTVSFDELSHEYHRYRYRVELCDFDWAKNERLFDSDYLRGETSDQPIDTYAKSLNTTVLYTHYAFKFPNDRVGVSVSGNYRITIFDDEEEQDIATVCFVVLDEKATVNATATSHTDIDQDRNHQQINFNVNAGNVRITNPQTEIKTLILQNNRWDNAVINPKSDFITPSDIQWKYAPGLIFKAANEYRKFETTNLHVGTLGVDHIRWFDPYYHVTLYEDKPRPNYIYDEDQNGAFYIRSEEYDDADTQTDYELVHFSLKREPILNGKLYVNGNFTNDRFLPKYEMSYVDETKCYEAVVLMKQGYYNYQYLYLPEGKTVGETELVEGDYFQTENKYTILVYYRPVGGRYDQLIGMREFRYIPGK